MYRYTHYPRQTGFMCLPLEVSVSYAFNKLDHWFYHSTKYSILVYISGYIPVFITCSIVLDLSALYKLYSLRTRKQLSPVRLLLLGYTGSIFIGTSLLLMPISHTQVLTYTEALFTATSALCVTGLSIIPVDTALSAIGQGILALLIQIGGMGVMTLSALLAIMTKHKLSHSNVYFFQSAIDKESQAYVIPIIQSIFKLTLTIEAIGACMMAVYFYLSGMPVLPSLGYSLFHAISAFCNAGFSLFSNSLENYRGHVGVNMVVMLLIFIMFGAGLVEKLPMAALTGLMIMVAIGTFEWASLKTLTKMPPSDIFVMVLVTGITAVLHNLALAVLIGVIIAALVFAWDNAKRIRARKRIDENGVKHYELYGPLFFGSVAVFNEKFDVLNDPEEVIIDFRESRVVDMSAIEALNKITERYQKVGKKVHLHHLSPDCRKLLKNAEQIIDVNVVEDPTYKLVVDGLS